MSKATRREFVKSTAAIGGFSILPSGLWANPPSSKLTYAQVGCGGNGRVTTRLMMSHPKLQVVALCDPDSQQLAKFDRTLFPKKGKKPAVEHFCRHQEMLSKMGDKLDCISVSTPDHNHHPVTMDAMKLGKHVYTQKPLTHKIHEARELQKAANEAGIVHRMGNQHHSSVASRTVAAIVRDGTIGKIRKVYAWSQKIAGDDGPERNPAKPAPDHLNWPVWLGNAPKQPYRDGIHPFKWRGYIDFGSSILGDMGVHIFDMPIKALELSLPKWVKTTCREPNGFGHPTATTAKYRFQATKYTTKDFMLTWFDGGHAKAMRVPELQLPEGRTLPDQGALYVGEKGIIVHPHKSGPMFYPQSIRQNIKKPDLPKMDHFHDWIDACIANRPISHANFNYSARLTESVLLGVIGNRFPGKKLEWDATNMKFTNMPQANRLA